MAVVAVTATTTGVVRGAVRVNLRTLDIVAVAAATVIGRANGSTSVRARRGGKTTLAAAGSTVTVGRIATIATDGKTAVSAVTVIAGMTAVVVTTATSVIRAETDADVDTMTTVDTAPTVIIARNETVATGKNATSEAVGAETTAADQTAHEMSVASAVITTETSTVTEAVDAATGQSRNAVEPSRDATSARVHMSCAPSAKLISTLSFPTRSPSATCRCGHVSSSKPSATKTM